MNEIEAQELAGEAWAAGCKLAEELLDAEWRIVERALINVLRKIGKGSDPVLLAAKEKIRRLRKALEPFAAVGPNHDNTSFPSTHNDNDFLPSKKSDLFPNDLKPCLFCGQEPPHLILRKDDYLIPNVFRVRCLGCLADGPYIGAPTFEEAKRLWNERKINENK